MLYQIGGGGNLRLNCMYSKIWRFDESQLKSELGINSTIFADRHCQQIVIQITVYTYLRTTKRFLFMLTRERSSFRNVLYARRKIMTFTLNSL